MITLKRIRRCDPSGWRMKRVCVAVLSWQSVGITRRISVHSPEVRCSDNGGTENPVPRGKTKSKAGAGSIVLDKGYKSSKHETNFWKKWKHSRSHAVHGNHELVLELRNLFEGIKSSALATSGAEKGEFKFQSWHKDPNDLLHDLETRPSQVGGFSLHKFKKRLSSFLECGVPLYDSICLSLEIPSCVFMSEKNIKILFTYLNSHGCSFGEIVHAHPYVLSLDTDIIKANLDSLCKAGVPHGRELNNILLKYPVLFYFHLEQSVGPLVQAAKLGLGVNQPCIESLLGPLNGIAVQSDVVSEQIVGPNASDASLDARECLYSLGINPLSVFQKCPEFFLIRKELLNIALDTLVGHPFYLEAEDLASLLKSYPETFMQFTKPEMKKLIKVIQKISSTNVRLYTLITQTPGVFQNPGYFLERVALFKSYGFTNKNIDELLSKKGAAICFVDCADSKAVPQLLELYIRNKDVSPTQITSSAPVSLSKQSVTEVSHRLGFLRQVRPEVLKEMPLRQIIKMDLESFVEEVCMSNLDMFKEYVVNKFSS